MEKLIAFILLVLLTPLIFILFVLTKLTSKGPFIFKQMRLGKDGKPFEIYKIRTMVNDAEEQKKGIRHLNEADGPVFKIKNDPRFTSFGRKLAYTGFDEILQLINIIKGEMSFVGPRPLPVSEAAQVPEEYKKRFSITPGITSFWVIRGAHELSFSQWMESDLEYISVRNPLLDLSIFIGTIMFITKWSVKHLFVIFYPLVLLFYAISPDSIWWFQIFTFLSFAFFLGFKLDAKIPKKVLVLIFFLFLSTALSINKVYSVPIFFSYLVILTISLTYSFDGNEIIRKSYIAGTVLMGLFSIIYTLTKIFLGNVPKFLSFLDTNTNLIIPYYGHAFYAIFLVATLPFVLDKFFKEKTFSRYILLIIYLVFILCSFSKTAIIVGSLEIAIYLFVKIKQRIVFSSSRIAIPLLTFLSLSVVVITLVLPKNDWLDQKINKPSIPARLEYWTQDFQIIKNSSPSRLMFGYGLDNFFELSNRFQSKPLYWTKSAHNFFIQFAIENGFIAAVILVFILISALRKNWKRYTLSEKVIAVSLLIYSFGSTYDIGIIIPVMMLFFLILFKKDNNDYSENSLLENANELKINKVFISLAIFVLLLFWSGYIFNFTHFNIFNQSKIQLLDVFPYSSAYWSIVIDKNANDSKKLMSIYDKLQKYSKSNVDLNKNIILKIYKNKDYCDAVNISKDYLESVPFDTEIQRTIMPIITNCPEIVDNNMDNYYMKIKKFYSSVEPDVVGMRGFFNFVASYYYRNDNSDEFQYWFNKSWQIQVDNKTDKWNGIAYTAPDQAFLIKKPFELTLMLKNINSLSGINLYGRPDMSLPYGAKLFIGTSENGKILHLDISNSISTEPITLYEGDLNVNDRVLRFAFNEEGSKIKISDYTGSVIALIDINQITKNKYKNGIFPDAKMYLGYGVSPKSKLIIKKFMIKPF